MLLAHGIVYSAGFSKEGAGLYGTREAKQKEGCEIPEGLERFKIPGQGRILQNFIQGQQKQGHDICIAGIYKVRG